MDLAEDLPGDLTLRAGQSASFPLRGALGSGNTWTVTTSDAGSVGASIDITPPETAGPRASPAWAAETLVVHAVTPGTAVVRARLARSWAPEPPADEHMITVTVEPAHKIDS